MIPVWIATIAVLDGAGVAKTLYFSDGAYIDDAWNYYEPRMAQPALVKVSPSDGGVFNVFSSPSIGEIELVNVDGSLNYLADYAVDNGNITLSLMDSNGQKIDYLTGKISATHSTDKSIFLTIRSMAELLSRTHTNTKYAGTNALPAGTEGVTDIKGNLKPKVFGSVVNAAPVFVNTSRLIYQFSDRNTCTVSAIYDKGAALTLGTTYTFANFATFETAAVTAGQFNRCCGFVKLGVTPTGTITGDAADSTTLAGDVFNEIVNELAFTPTITFDTASKTTLNAAGAVGIYVTGETSTASLLGQIVASCGAYWFFSGSVIYSNLIAITSTSVLDVTDSEIISIERTANGLGSNGVPITACVISYDKIETVQAVTELAGSVTDARKGYLSQATRNSFIYDSAVLTRHPLAENINIESVLRSATDANTVGTRLLNLSKVRVDVVHITAVVSEIPALTLGQGITVYTPRLGYGDGKIFTITEIEIDAKKKRIIIGGVG